MVNFEHNKISSKDESFRKKKCKVEVFSRVTGFFRPVQEWNTGKQEEFKDRNHFQMKELGR